MKSPNIYIETYGCQMNRLDSETVASILEKAGFDVNNMSIQPSLSELCDADIILLNTCGVREKAERRVYGRIGELTSLRKKRPNLILGVIGCMAQRLDKQLLTALVKIIAGPDSYRNLPEMINSVYTFPEDTSRKVRVKKPSSQMGDSDALKEYIVDTELISNETYVDIDPLRSSDYSAWIAVTRGCNNYCSYCIVPYTRGRERSVHYSQILADIDKLVANGYKEVTLLGQNVNSYQSDSVGFADLLGRVADTGIESIRFMTSHPRDLSDDVLSVMAKRDNICNHLHLPLQSGSDSVLKAMNRGYTVKEYLAIVDKARSAFKNSDELSITTDLIFGFPSESDDDFHATLDIMKLVRFDFGFLYRYSGREGTKSCDLPGSIPEKLRIKRLQEGISLQQTISREKIGKLAGTLHKVLIKGRSKDGVDWLGMSEMNIPVVVAADTSLSIGSFVKVRIESTTGASLLGKVEK